MAQLRSLAILATIAGTVATTLWGLSQMQSTALSPFAGGSLRWSALYILFGALAIDQLSSRMKINRLAAGCVLACAISVLTGTILPLLVTIWFAFASYALGGAIFDIFKISKDKLSGITAVVVGAGAYGTAVGLAAHFPINYPGAYGFALAIPVALRWRSIRTGLLSLAEDAKKPSESKWQDLAISLVGLVHFAVALMPEVGHDALAMHLFIPAQLATRHEWNFDVTTYAWAVMPMMGDWIFSIGYMLAGETAARLINVGFIFVLSWLVRDIVICAGGSTLGTRWAVLLFLTTPLTFTESSSLFIESVWATFTIAGSLAIFKLLDRNDDHSAHIMTGGFLLGAALAAKAVTLTILPVLFILLLAHFRAWGSSKRIGTVATGLLLFVVVGGIPYATAWQLTGNPVFPFFNEIFKSAHWPPVAFEAPSIFGKGITWDVVYQATFHTERFLEAKPGASGFQWILLFYPVLLIMMVFQQRKGLVLFSVAAACIALTFQSINYLRYIFPSYSWMAAGIGVAFTVIDKEAVFVKKALSLVGWAAVVLNLMFFKSGTYYGELSLQALMSQSGKETYLNSQLPIRGAIELTNRLNAAHTPVAVFSSPLTAGLNSDGLYPNWYNYRFQAQVTQTASSEDVARVLSDRGVDYVVLDANWGEAGKRKTIEDATTKIYEQGSTTVRKLKMDHLFQTELLKNKDFASHDGWSLPTQIYEQRANRISVSVSEPATQAVPVRAGRHYRNTVTAYCKDRPTQGRVQVNWLDENASFISTDIQVFDCAASEVTYAMDVTAPTRASTAVVYATGHTSIPVTFSEISFKQ